MRSLLMLVLLALPGFAGASSPQPLSGFPHAGNTGVPSGWTPKATHSGAYAIATPGAVVEDIRVDGSILVQAPNVTLRRVEVLGGGIANRQPGLGCNNGLVLEDVSIISPNRTFEALGKGGYTARRLKVESAEGARVGGKSHGCGPVVIEDSFIRVTAPQWCGDWHGDGIQGYSGAALTVRNVTLHLVERFYCGGTAPFFYPHSQDNTSVDIDRLLVRGGGAPFRLGMPGSVRGLKIVDKSWAHFPKDVKCSVITAWDAQIVEIDANYQVRRVVRREPCNTEGGG